MTLYFAFFALNLFLTFVYIVVPIRKHLKANSSIEFAKVLKLIKLKAIKQHYPAVSKLSYEEIEKKYNVDDAYQRIGRL